MEASVQTIMERVDAVTNILPQYRNPTPPCPRSVKIELTGLCNFKCWFCATGKKLREQSGMDPDFFKSVVSEMREVGVEELGLFYLGESFLCKWLPDAVKFAKQIGYSYVFLTTNGYSATRDLVAQCIENGLDSLKFSFNFGDVEQCKEVTKVDAFERIIEHIGYARHERDRIERLTGHRCGIAASSIRFTGEQQERMEAAVARIKPLVDHHYWLPLYSQAGLIDEEGKAYTAGNRGRLDALREPIPCWAIFTEGHVTWDGKLSACCFGHTDEFDMGDLNEDTFMDAWHSDKFRELRAAHLREDISETGCMACVAYAG